MSSVTGVLYASFKKGAGAQWRGDRYFLDLQMPEAREAFARVGGWASIGTWETPDVRAGRQGEWWVNPVLRKVP